MSVINTPAEALAAMQARLVAHDALRDSLPLPTAQLVADLLELAEQGLDRQRAFGIEPYYADQAVAMVPKYRALLLVLNDPRNAPDIAMCDRIIAAATPEPRGMRDAQGRVT